MATAAATATATASASAPSSVNPPENKYSQWLKDYTAKLEEEAALLKDAVIKLAVSDCKTAPEHDPRVKMLKTLGEFGHAALALNPPQVAVPKFQLARVLYAFPESCDGLKHCTLIEWLKPWGPNYPTRCGATCVTKYAMVALAKTQSITPNVSFWQWSLVEYNHKYATGGLKEPLKCLQESDSALFKVLAFDLLERVKWPGHRIPAVPETHAVACMVCWAVPSRKSQRIAICCGARLCVGCTAACNAKCPNCRALLLTKQYWSPT